MPQSRPDPADRSANLPRPELSERIRGLMEGSPPSPAALRAAESLRRLTRWLVSHDDVGDGVEKLADALDRVERDLERHVVASRFPEETAPGREALRAGFHPNTRGTHPLVGRANPVAPPIELAVDGDRATGDLCFDAAHEGMPSCAHGGYIAAGFDIVMIQAATTSWKNGGVTGTLTVRYVGLTPTGVPLRYEAWHDRTEGRKIYVKAHLRTNPPRGSADESRVTAEAEGVFVAARDD
jgi:acyl-coenzyme A thioesterase PaaI-like protein